LVELNHRERYVRAKILYYGPAAGGKTTSLQVLHRRARATQKMELISVNTAQDRTILFDLLPLRTLAFRSYELRFQVVAVPGQRLYAATRKMLLKGADTIVFVANSAADRFQENLQSLKEMTENLLSHGIDPSSIAVVFQFNKRDLPDITELMVMNRALNARSAESFPSIAIREEGVLETFAAALRVTMTELSTRYKIGEDVKGPRSAREWTERAMKETFEMPKSAPAETPTPAPTPQASLPSVPAVPAAPAEPRAATILRVRAPSTSRTTLGAKNASLPTPSVSESAPSAAAEAQDPKGAQALVESYAEAAAGLTDHLGRAREERDEALRRLEELYAVADVGRSLLHAAPDRAQILLEGIVKKMSTIFRTSQASLAFLRPDGELEVIVRHGIEEDPLALAKSSQGKPLAASLVEEGKLRLELRGTRGPLGDAIEKAGPHCVAALVLPLQTPARPLGLLVFYLPEEASIPTEFEMEHLERMAIGLTLTLEAASEAASSERLEAITKDALAGQLAQRVFRSAEGPIDRIISSVYRLRSRTGAPDWLVDGLAEIEDTVFHLQKMGRALAAFGEEDLPPTERIALTSLLADVEKDFRVPLAEAGISLQIENKAGEGFVRAEPVLLRALVGGLIGNARWCLDGITSGGVVRVIVPATDTNVQISVFHNAAAMASRRAPAQALAWPFDRRLSAVNLRLVETLAGYFQGELKTETRERIGTMTTVFLPKD
jgi:signal recognition particle receptor subunit beta